MSEPKVRMIEAIDLANGMIQVRRQITKYRGDLTVEVKDERGRYLQATAFKGEEIYNLFHFLKPLVVRHLETFRNYYESVIPDNEEKLKRAKESEKPTRVWDFFDKSYYRGRKDLSVEDAEAKLLEQKQKLTAIKKELKILEAL